MKGEKTESNRTYTSDETQQMSSPLDNNGCHTSSISASIPKSCPSTSPIHSFLAHNHVVGSLNPTVSLSVQWWFLPSYRLVIVFTNPSSPGCVRHAGCMGLNLPSYHAADAKSLWAHSSVKPMTIVPNACFRNTCPI